MVSCFINVFANINGVHGNGLIEEVIPYQMTNNVNNLLTMIPSRDETQDAVFSMNKQEAHDPD